jgi:hypothetical protein
VARGFADREWQAGDFANARGKRLARGERAYHYRAQY